MILISDKVEFMQKKNIKWDKERYFISLKATINNKV